MLKPLQGSGGAGVFLVSDEESPNLNQIIEAISRDGYVVAQEYLRAPTTATCGSSCSTARRWSATGSSPRSGAPTPAPTCGRTCTSAAKRSRSRSPTRCSSWSRSVRPKLLADGMFLVGLDIVGSKLMEINVFSPGGLGVVEELCGIPANDMVIEALEHKVELRRQYGTDLRNAQLATL